MDGILVVDSFGKVTMRGVDYGGRGERLAENDDFVVVKWPGHRRWVPIGEGQYHGPKICVFKKEERPANHDDEGIWVEELIGWSTSRASTKKRDCMHRLKKIDEPPFRYRCVRCGEKFVKATGMIIG